MKFIIAVVIATTLSACSSASPVVPTGKDAYMVGVQVRGGLTSDTEVKIQAIQRANEFCEGRGKRAEITGSNSTGLRGWTPQNAEVNFTCVTK